MLIFFQNNIWDYPELLLPNLNKITLRLWGAKEFAVMD